MKTLWILAAFGFLLLSSRASSIEEYRTDAEAAAAYNVTRKHKVVDGHVFYVEEDRPIEKVAGLYRPMDMDSYIALKFSKLQAQIDELRKETKANVDDIKAQIDDLSRKIDQVSRRQAASPPAAANTTRP
ncbi:MAG: hypothetical protein WC732_05915 [Candidatus Omnitrophota bacterium]